MRELFTWEEEQNMQLITLLIVAQWKSSATDGWIWKDGDLRKYTVVSGYKALHEFVSLSSYNDFNELWSLKVAGSTQLDNVKKVTN